MIKSSLLKQRKKLVKFKLTQYYTPSRRQRLYRASIEKLQKKKKFKHRPSLAGLEACPLILNITIYGAVQLSSIFSGVIYPSKWNTFSFNPLCSCCCCFFYYKIIWISQNITFSCSNYNVSKNKMKSFFSQV